MKRDKKVWFIQFLHEVQSESHVSSTIYQTVDVFLKTGSSGLAMTLYVWCVPLSQCPLHSCHVVLWACLLSHSKLPIDSVCHGLAQGPQRVAFVCSQPCPVSICCWDGLQCCHHPNQNKWTFVCCLLLNLSEYVPQKQEENSNEAQLLHFC